MLRSRVEELEVSVEVVVSEEGFGGPVDIGSGVEGISKDVVDSDDEFVSILAEKDD